MNKELGDLTEGVDSETSLSSGQGGSCYSPTLGLPVKISTILVVDDERTLRLVLKWVMQKEAYKVVEASNGAQCLELCQQYLPDLILLDAMMPVMDGFSCCAQLRSQFGEQCPPVLMITALDDQTSVDMAFEVGAADYITKPIHWAVLRQRVRRMLQTRWAIMELHHQMERERSLMAQLEIANQTLQRLVDLDSLTQIANRRCFDECLRREWWRLVQEGAPLSVILCDIDGFKIYNDTYGHQAGDKCLQQVASLLDRSVQQWHCMAARYGGEEFVVILPNAALSEAVQVAEAIQTKLRIKAIPAVGGRFVTLSFGVASTIPTSIAVPHNLIAVADKALYEAKQTGRDRIVVGKL
jgi:diguanylate cyclase (GGDEF)-like protein